MTVYDYREITLKDDLCLEISRDTDIENPRENDCNAATFYCLKSPRRKIGDIIDSAYHLNETKRTLAKTGEYAILPIYIHEHSDIALRTVPFSDIWDSACIGFAVANINDFMKRRISDTPVSRCEAMHRAEDCIRNELEAYSDYLAGNCWQYCITDEDGNVVDSCSGCDDDMETDQPLAIIADGIRADGDESKRILWVDEDVTCVKSMNDDYLNRQKAITEKQLSDLSSGIFLQNFDYIVYGKRLASKSENTVEFVENTIVSHNKQELEVVASGMEAMGLSVETGYFDPDDESSVDVPKQLVGFHYVVLKKNV